MIKGEGFAIDASLILADSSRIKTLTGEEILDSWDIETATRAVREYFEALDSENKSHTHTTFKYVSPADPLSSCMRNRRGNVGYYSTNYLVDIENNIIVDVEATPLHRIAEVDSTKTMINRVNEYYGIIPERLLGDTAYGTAEMLNWTVEKGIL